jgi:hypothetical protein
MKLKSNSSIDVSVEESVVSRQRPDGKWQPFYQLGIKLIGIYPHTILKQEEAKELAELLMERVPVLEYVNERLTRPFENSIYDRDGNLR